MVRDYQHKDTQQICDIYSYYVEETINTFERTAPNAEEMSKHIAEVTTRFPWLVYEEDKSILGFAYATRWKLRCAYEHSVESSVYVRPNHHGKKIGTSLYKELISKLRKLEIHTMVAGIAQPNEASVALHEKMGFKKAAHFSEIGWKFDRWVDVGYWQLLLK